MPKQYWECAINFDAHFPHKAHLVFPLPPSLGQELLLISVACLFLFGLITSRRQTISVSVSPTPYESFIGHLPGVTFSANCSLSILCQLYYRCLFKTVCARNNSPNKGTASDEKDMFSHHKGLIYLNLSS